MKKIPTLLIRTTLAFVCLGAFIGCSDTKPQSTLEIAISPAVESHQTELPMIETERVWRNDPALAGKFHPGYPDDLQVIVHEGGPRLTTTRPELIWVRVTGKKGEAYQGRLLNQPHQLPSLKQDDAILFLAPNAQNEPYLVTEKYLHERKDWHILPCNKCGMPDLFDAPSALQAKVFPNVPADAEIEAFTSFCPVCGGVQIVSSSPILGEP